jgi:hypothetical protein
MERVRDAVERIENEVALQPESERDLFVERRYTEDELALPPEVAQRLRRRNTRVHWIAAGRHLPWRTFPINRLFIRHLLQAGWLQGPTVGYLRGVASFGNRKLALLGSTQEGPIDLLPIQADWVIARLGAASPLARFEKWFPGVWKKYAEPEARRLWPDGSPALSSRTQESKPATMLEAEFILRADGSPVSSPGKKRRAPIYHMRLSLRHVPLSAVSYVTYDLHPEKNRRERTVRIQPHFEHTIYSWGDYRIRVRLSDGSELEAQLSEALRNRYGTPPPPEVAPAIQSIADNRL